MKTLKGLDENTAIPERWCVRRTPENADKVEPFEVVAYE